jgi:diguanylate cyclase (GGDEF)-like protein
MQQNGKRADTGPFIRLLLETVDPGAEGAPPGRERAAASACRFFEAEVLYVVTPENSGWRKVTFGPDGPLGEERLDRLTGIVRNVVNRRSGFLESRPTAHGAFHRHRDGWPGMETASYVAVPLLRRGRIHGAVVLLRATGRPSFTEDDLHCAEAFAGALAVRGETVDRLEELGRMARTDPLTRLANYRCLREEMTRVLHSGRHLGESFAIVMVDIDNLRRINDRLGHLAGSEVLCRFSRLLERHVRAEDLIAKYGGDEFILLLPGASREGAETVAMRVREAAQEEASGLTRGDRLSCSCGVALFPEDGTDYASLISAADRAVIRDKMGGRDPLSVEEPENRRAA